MSPYLIYWSWLRLLCAFGDHRYLIRIYHGHSTTTFCQICGGDV